MSQKDDVKSDQSTEQANKWRDLAEQMKVDDEHLLAEEKASKPEEAMPVSDEALRDKLVLLEKQVALLRDQVARAHAEAENTRRRMEQEVAKARKFGVERLVSDLVPVLDSLVRAMEGVTGDDPRIQSMRQGIELTLDLLHKLLEKNGVSKINPSVGDTFDPTQHEAMSMRADPDAKTNTILQVLQQGYALNGRVIRAAMVIVTA